MTTDAASNHVPFRPAAPSAVGTGITLVAGCIAMLARPVSKAFIPITLAVAFAAVVHGITTSSRSGRHIWVLSVAVGSAAFLISRSLLGPSLLPPPTKWFVVSLVLAAIAEEIFFRGLAYEALMRFGLPVAIGGSSVLFAIVHVRLWGWPAFPVDLAAGLVLAWQRMTTGSWTAPAVTHVVANLVILL